MVQTVSRSDLHLHSTASDGLLEPTQLVRVLAEREVGWAALTDHDTVAGLPPAQEAARTLGVDLLAGVELSVDCGGEAVHLLALGVDVDDPEFGAWVDGYRVDRVERAERILARLREREVPVDRDAVRGRAEGGIVARPHIADAIVAAGGADSAAAAFVLYIGDGAPCHVPLPPRPASDAIFRVHRAGGIAVLAHPGDWTARATIRLLVLAGLDGIEAGHPSHDAVLRDYYTRLADQADLVVTAGSDFHGRDPADLDRIGTFGLEEPRRDLLRERLHSARTRAG